MAEFLSDAWVTNLPTAGGDAGAPGPTTSIAFEVGAGRANDVKFSVDLVDGRIAASAVGPRADAAVLFTMTRADADALLAREMALDVAFMRGKLKAAGDMDHVLAVLEWSATESYQALHDAIAAATE